MDDRHGKHSRIEIKETAIAPVIAQLRAISTEQVNEVRERMEKDPKVGIGVINLTEAGAIVAVEAGEPPLRYQFYAAHVPAKGHVKSHYHEHGPEPYRFISADGGEMNLGHVIKSSRNKRVEWHTSHSVSENDEVEIKEKEVHSFYNTSKTKAVFFLFACPAEHLVDHDEKNSHGDRYLVEDWKGGIPPQHRMKN